MDKIKDITPEDKQNNGNFSNKVRTPTNNLKNKQNKD